MTQNLISHIKSGVGRKKTNFEQMPARFSEGTLARIDAVLKPGAENRADFIRTAVEHEVRRRERGKSREMGVGKIIPADDS